MRRATPIIIALVVVMAFVGTLGFLYRQSQPVPIVYELVEPAVRDVVHKTVASGSIVPRTEIEIKSRVSGVVHHLAVEPGDLVEQDQLIAHIRIIPDNVSLNNAEGSVRAAKINRDDARQQHQRDLALHDKGAISDVTLEESKVGLELREQQYRSALDNLSLIREGASRSSSMVSTEVRSTLAGMVLDVPVKQGESVIESNTFNAGTTIAIVADMTDMVFEGDLDESEVGKVAEGMGLEIEVGAIQGQRFVGSLEYVAPKGTPNADGSIKFKIRAAMEIPEGVFVRSASSATADIVLDRRDQVLTVPESILTFESGATTIQVEKGEQFFEARSVELGLSDGIHVEVLDGVAKGERFRGREQAS